MGDAGRHPCQFNLEPLTSVVRVVVWRRGNGHVDGEASIINATIAKVLHKLLRLSDACGRIGSPCCGHAQVVSSGRLKANDV